jgi:general secretion pathway protein E
MSLFGTNRKILKNGLIDADDDRREIVAVYETGEIFYATGKRFHKFVTEAQTYVTRELRKDPALTEVLPADVLGHYKAVSGDDSRGKSEAHERLAERILRDAASSRTSDIKIIRTPERTIVRFMIAGQEIDYGVSVTSLEGNALIAYIFDTRDEGAGHSTKQKGEFQGFSVSNARRSGSGLVLPDNVLKLRCQKGFHETNADLMDHLVIRIFYRETEEMASLESLGLDPYALRALKGAREGMKGAVIIGGETGDGKSTTIISAVKRQYDEYEGQISIVTVEDPVEYKLDEPGIVQIPIQSSGDAEKRTANYRAALMHFVRINPHVGVVSEIRDAEAARQVLQFIETGHQVWTTIHINAVNSIPFRLIDMGIEPTELSKPKSLRLMMKQTLVPLLCRCATRDERGFWRRNREGCQVCRSRVKGPEAEKAWSGYQRQIAVTEFIEPDDTYLTLVRQNDAIGAKNYWERPQDKGGMGGVTLSEKLNMLVHLGVCDPKDVIKKGAQILPKPDKMDEMLKGWGLGLLRGRR